jgi:hypothetical protein
MAPRDANFAAAIAANGTNIPNLLLNKYVIAYLR